MAAPHAGARRLRRAWPQRLLISLNVFLVFACLVTAGGLGYFYFKFGELPRVALGGFLDQEEGSGSPQNFLLVGTDSAARLTPGSPELAGREGVTGERTDTMMILRIDPRTEEAWLLSVPRDLWVDIADQDSRNRINTSFNNGNAGRLIKTIRDNFGIQIHHYVQVDFAGFKRLVDAVGGVPIYFPAPARDINSGLRVDQVGCVTLDGNQALAYARSRHYQSFESGQWRTDPTGDIGRITRQQTFIRKALQRSIGKGIRNLVKLNRMINVTLDNVKIDDNLSGNDIFRLGRRFRAIEPDTVNTFTLPTRAGSIGGASVLFLEEADASKVLDVFRGVDTTAAGAVVPAQVRVRVLNGSGIGGQAGKAADALGFVDFTIAGTGDADSFDYSRTTIRYAPGKEAHARLLARYLEHGAQVEAADTVNAADVVLITGQDFTRVLERPGAATGGPDSGATSTTTRPTTTTIPSSVGGVAPQGDPAEQTCG